MTTGLGGVQTLSSEGLQRGRVARGLGAREAALITIALGALSFPGEQTGRQLLSFSGTEESERWELNYVPRKCCSPDLWMGLWECHSALCVT